MVPELDPTHRQYYFMFFIGPFMKANYAVIKGLQTSLENITKPREISAKTGLALFYGHKSWGAETTKFTAV